MYMPAFKAKKLIFLPYAAITAGDTGSLKEISAALPVHQSVSLETAPILASRTEDEAVDINILCRLFQHQCRRRAAFARLNRNCGG